MDAKNPLAVRPLVIKKSNIAFISNGQQHDALSAGNLLKNLFREDVLYDTNDMYFLKGEFQRLLLVNRFNIVTKHCRTVAKYFREDGSVLEKTSDRVTEVIGQDQFNTLFTALCSILDQQLKIRSILTLLTGKPVKVEKEDAGYSEKPGPIKIFVENSCQTDEMRIEALKTKKKRIRKPCSPYIIQDKTEEQDIVERKPVKNVTGYKPSNKRPHSNDSGTESLPETPLGEKKNPIGQNIGSQNTEKRNTAPNLPDLGYLRDDEHSNDSDTRFSILSDTPTHPELINNPLAICNMVDQHTKEAYKIVVQGEFPIPGTDIKVAYKPEDIFHIATKENLQLLEEGQRRKLLQHQFSIDFRHCLTPLDEDGNLPIHLAVLNNDLELLSRQCLVLKMRGASVDVVAPSTGMTAMQLAIQLELAPLVSCLARHSALLRADSVHRTPLHVAAERPHDVLAALVARSVSRARELLCEVEELWSPEMEAQTDDELAGRLMQHACSMFDKQGYSPVMLAARLGLYENVRLLLEHSPSTVNDRMPTTGNTALYLAIAAAFTSCVESGNKAVVADHFLKTIEVLMDFDADPFIENHSSIPTNVHTLLLEFNNTDLCRLVSNKQINTICKKKNINIKPDADDESNSANLMFVVDDNGVVECKSISSKKNKRATKKGTEKMAENKVAGQKVGGTKVVGEKAGGIKVAGKKMGGTKVVGEKAGGIKVAGEKAGGKKMMDKMVVETKDLEKTIVAVKEMETQIKNEPSPGKLVILENALLKPSNPGSPNLNSGTSKNENIIKKVSPKIVRIAQTKVVLAKNSPQKRSQAVKRKQSDGPNVIKQAKVGE